MKTKRFTFDLDPIFLPLGDGSRKLNPFGNVIPPSDSASIGIFRAVRWYIREICVPVEYSLIITDHKLNFVRCLNLRDTALAYYFYHKGKIPRKLSIIPTSMLKFY